MNSILLLANTMEPGAGADLHFFAIVFLISLLCAVLCFALGTLFGWCQWVFFSRKTMAKLERSNADLRRQLNEAEPSAS